MHYPYHYTSHHFVRVAQKALQHMLYFSQNKQEMSPIFSAMNIRLWIWY